MKKFVENLDPEIGLVTILLFLSIGVYYFGLNFNLILLLWFVISLLIQIVSFFYQKCHKKNSF